MLKNQKATDDHRHIPEPNFHVRLVQSALRITKAEKAMELFNRLIQPLPDWAQALSSTIFISVVPIFVIYALNAAFLSQPSLRDKVIYYLISFAIGGLLGDVFFHTLTHLSAGSGHEHHHHGHDHEGHSHDPAQMGTNCIIIAGILGFFLIEKIVQTYLSDGHDHHHH
jgi:zinc transporter ZupT